MSVLPIQRGISSSCDYVRPVLSEESKALLQSLKQITFNSLFKEDRGLVRRLSIIDPIELTNVVKSLFVEMVREDSMNDPITFVDRLASIIPFQKIHEAVQDHELDGLQEAKSMFEEAKMYLQTTQSNLSTPIRTCLFSVLDGIVSMIENIISGFGVGDLFQSSDNILSAERKSEKIMMLLTACSAVATMAVSFLGAMTAAALIGGSILTIVALSILWPSIRPMPSQLPHAENWTKQVLKDGCIAQGRRESLDSIADILKMRRHALVVGPSRVGKSLTVKAFAAAIARGDYPELKGKTVFYMNTSELLGQQASFLGGGNDVLKRISVAIGRHRDNCIVVLDEIHNACESRENLAEQLKTLLDEGGEFPHVIGITTDKEYEERVKKNTAFSLRFDKVAIENTGYDETIKIVSDEFMRSSSKPFLEEGVLDRIYEATSKVALAPQPASSLKLFKQCIQRLEKRRESLTAKQMREVSNKIHALRSKSIVCHDRAKEIRVQIDELERSLSELQRAVCKEQEALKKFENVKKTLNLVIREKYRSVLKISKVVQTTLSPKSENHLKRFLLIHQFLEGALEYSLKEQASSLGIRVVIDKALVDEVAAS